MSAREKLMAVFSSWAFIGALGACAVLSLIALLTQWTRPMAMAPCFPISAIAIAITLTVAGYLSIHHQLEVDRLLAAVEHQPATVSQVQDRLVLVVCVGDQDVFPAATVVRDVAGVGRFAGVAITRNRITGRRDPAVPASSILARWLWERRRLPMRRTARRM